MVSNFARFFRLGSSQNSALPPHYLYLMIAVSAMSGSSLYAGLHNAGNGAGQMVFSTDQGTIEVEGECVDWNFQIEQDGNAPVIASILVNLDRDSGTTIASLGSAMINLGDVFWAFEIDGDIDHSGPVYAFTGTAKNLKAPQDPPVPAKIEVTCN